MDEEITEEPMDEQIAEFGVKKYGELIDAHLRFGNYNAAKVLYADLKWFIEEIPHDEMVALVNSMGVTHPSAGWLAKAWCENHGIKSADIEFETAGCIAPPGDTLCYRRSKKTWGNLVSISNDLYAAERAQSGGEESLRLHFYLKENNPIRQKQTTRNEVKAHFGSKFVNDAMSTNKAEFIKDIGQQEADMVERFTGMPIGKVWSAVRNGSKELVEHLSRIPSTKRDQMRRRGMYVTNHDDPQIVLVEHLSRVTSTKRNQKRRQGMLVATHDDTQMDLFQ